MRFTYLFLLLGLAACSAPASDVTLTISGISMQDLATLQKELASIDGVSDIRVGKLKDGTITLTVRSTHKGSDLATKLAGRQSGLKNVKGCDEKSISIDYAVASPPPAPLGMVPLPVQPQPVSQPQEAPLSTFVGSGIRPELVGTWGKAGGTSNAEGAYSSAITLTLNADGTWQMEQEGGGAGHQTDGLQYGSGSQSSASGTWTATDDSITFTEQDGSRTYRLEKRNHSKTGDPMIVLDGLELVTVHQREPW